MATPDYSAMSDAELQEAAQKMDKKYFLIAGIAAVIVVGILVFFFLGEERKPAIIIPVVVMIFTVGTIARQRKVLKQELAKRQKVS